MIRPRLGVCVLLGLFVAADASTLERWEWGEASLEISGSMLEQLTFTQGTDADEFVAKSESDFACLSPATFANCRGFEAVGDWFVPVSLTRLRTRLDFRANDNWSAVVIYDNELLAGRLNGFGSAIGSEIGGSSFLHAEDDIESGEYATWRHLLSLVRQTQFFEDLL